jgi:hypothetical protein
MNLPWQIRFEVLPFEKALPKFQLEFGLGPTLIFIDQNGVKHLTRDVFTTLTRCKITDFMFFLASGYKHRFKDLAPEIVYPPDTPLHLAHRVVADTYREWAPKDMFVGSFSIEDDKSVNGLVFVSHHWRGIQKFLDAAWKLGGEADFDIEADTRQGSWDFETGASGFKQRKLDFFKEELFKAIASRRLRNERDVFLTCVANGFLPRTAKSVYERLMKEQVIKNTGENRPRISDIVMKKRPRTFEF